METVAPSPIITLTELAVSKIQEFQDINGAAALRASVRGGGCSGYQYQLALDHPHDSDLVWEQDGVEIAVPKDAVAFLQGSVLDYKTTLMGAGFEFVSNPNVTGGCGCGSSFRVDAQEGCDSEQGVGALDGAYDTAAYADTAEVDGVYGLEEESAL